MIHIPIRTVPGLNAREHWRARVKRVQQERWATLVAFGIAPLYSAKHAPCTVRLTRVAPSNGLDTDNLVGSLKAVRDAVAQIMNIDDKHDHLVRYVYAQKRGPWGVEIEFGEYTKEAEFKPLEVHA